MFYRRPLLKCLCVMPVLLATCFSTQAIGQDGYPNKPVTFVVPFAAAGSADVMARSLAQKLSERLRVPVIVENKPGASGNVGSAAVAKGPADGYTLLLGTSSTIAINPHLFGTSMSYDPVKDLQPVSLINVMTNVLVVNPQTPFHTVGDVVAASKAKPASLSFGSPGSGNTMHLAAELFKTQAGINMVHVPYKSGPNALNDVIAGHIPLMFNSLPVVVDLIKAGRLRALAVTSRTRSSLLPNVPTMIEAGVPDFEIMVWLGVMVKAGTPAVIVHRLNKEIVAILEMPSFRKSLEDQGYVATTNTPEQFSALIAADLKTWGRVVSESGAKLD